MSRPVIGEFRSTPNNAPRTEAPKSSFAAPPVEKPAMPEKVEAKEPEQDIADAANVPEELTPAERYRRRLEASKITLDEATTIFDAVLEKGFYEEYVNIRGQRAVFRTRTYEDQLRLQTVLEAAAPRLQGTLDDIVARYNLAASLYEWRGKIIKHDNDEDFEKILTMLRRMPGPLISLLTEALYKFDAKIMVIFSEGATDSF